MVQKLKLKNRGDTTINWVFEYQPIVSEILTQLSCYIKVESNLIPRRGKKSQLVGPVSGLGYTSIQKSIKKIYLIGWKGKNWKKIQQKDEVFIQGVVARNTFELEFSKPFFFF